MRRVLAGAVILLALSVLSPPAVAHHSTTAEFDAKSSAGAAEAWRFESNPPAWFRRVGVSRADFAKAIGQTITVEGNRAKDGSLYGYLVKVTFADGSSLELVAPGAAAP